MPANTPQRKPVKYLDAKVMIATLAVAVTIGLWNLFSVNAVRAEKAAPPALQAGPPDASAAQTQDLLPLPTLVPLVTLQDLPARAAPVEAGQAGQVPVQTGKLRSVTAPSVTIVQRNKPLVDAPVVSSGGGGGGGGRRPAARSRAS